MNLQKKPTGPLAGVRHKGLFLMIFACTLISLVTVLISLFIALAYDDGGSVPASKNIINDNSGINKKPITDTENTQSTTQTDPAVTTLGFNLTTKPSRSSYIIGSASDVKTLTSQISSNYTILVELGSYQSIVEKNADEKMYPASMTKVMTLIAACENLKNENVMLKIAGEDVEFAQKEDLSGAGLNAGESVYLLDLLYLISYKSDAVACLTVAKYIAGSEENFVTLMNNVVAKLGLKGTHFSNCTGLHAADNYSTCRDMATIMAYALDNEMVYNLLSSYKGYRVTTSERSFLAYSGWYSDDRRFADNPKLNSVTVKAGKTGYLTESGASLVSYAEGKDGKKYINVTVGNPKGGAIVSAATSTTDVKWVYNNYAK